MHSSTIASLAALLAFSAAAAPAAPFDDRMITYGGGKLVEAPLPAGPAGTPRAADDTIEVIFALPNGQLLAIAPYPLPIFSAFTGLSTVRADGSLDPHGYVSTDQPDQPFEVLDMDVDHRGLLYLLLRWHALETPDQLHYQLQQYDLEYGAQSHRELPAAVTSIATAADGLWAIADGQLRHLDLDQLWLGPAVAELGEASNLEADSQGLLYFNRSCSPPCGRLATVDPATGVVAEAPPALYAGTPAASRFTIRRRCASTNKEICLQDGRFRAGVEFLTSEGNPLLGNVAAMRSSDTGIFYFFDPDNWELMVKVLDGCAINGHFWVYSSASTDVGYTMTITDTATGAVKTYRNPAGQVALTVTDGQAFACSPQP